MKYLILVLSLGLANSAFAKTVVYQCSPAANNSSTNPLVLTSTDGALTLQNQGEANSYRLALDPSYKPRANNANYNRYNTEFTFDEEYQTAVMISKDVEKLSKVVTLKIFSRGEGFFNDFFTCTR